MLTVSAQCRGGMFVDTIFISFLSEKELAYTVGYAVHQPVTKTRSFCITRLGALALEETGRNSPR